MVDGVAHFLRQSKTFSLLTFLFVRFRCTEVESGAEKDEL